MFMRMAKKKTVSNPCATNIYLPSAMKTMARVLAKEKGMSLSELIQRLLVAESKRKRGIAHLSSPKEIA